MEEEEARGVLLMSTRTAEIEKLRDREATWSTTASKELLRDPYLRKRGRREVHPHRAACSTTPAAWRSSRISWTALEKRFRELRRPPARRSTTRCCSSTASRPSASRASPSTWPIATSPPRQAASSSSRTRPGHVQYTRNMATGASTADLAIILVDARKGVLDQTRRHAFIASLLGIKPRGGGGQQDGPGRLQPRTCSTRSRGEIVDFSREAGDHGSCISFRCRRSRPATTSCKRSENLAWYQRRPAAGLPGDGQHRVATAT